MGTGVIQLKHSSRSPTNADSAVLRFVMFLYCFIIVLTLLCYENLCMV